MKRAKEKKLISLTLTDPPYGINVVKNNRLSIVQKTELGDDVSEYGCIGGYGGRRYTSSKVYKIMKNDTNIEACRKAYPIMQNISDNQIIWGGNYFIDFLKPSRCWIVWHKFNVANNYPKIELAWTSFNHNSMYYYWLWNGLIRQGCQKDELKSRIHPSQKPVGLYANILRDFSKEGDHVYDPFSGSGTGLIACEKTGRISLSGEIEDYYCQMIIDRWEKYTGRKAQLVSVAEPKVWKLGRHYLIHGDCTIPEVVDKLVFFALNATIF